MAKYYYVPLYLAPSMRQPVARPTRSAYQPGLTDPITLVTTSAVQALVAAGVDLDTYSDANGWIETIPTNDRCKIPGQFPRLGDIAQYGQYSGFQYSPAVSLQTSLPPPSAATNGTDRNSSTLLGGDAWPGPPAQVTVFSSTGANGEMGLVSNTIGSSGAGGPFPPGSRTIARPAWFRTAILYVDTVRRMVIETPDAFVDGPFIANGWIQRTHNQVNADYPLTIQGLQSGQRTRP